MTPLSSPKNVLFLYTEIAAYFLACVRTLVEEHPVNVHLVRWPVNQEAPFEFETGNKVQVYERNAYSDAQLAALVKTIRPDIIVCSGWIDKGYMKVAKQYFKKIPTVLTIDNHWLGNIKQRVAALASPFVLRSKFSHVWVPGAPQKAYAQKLGFKEDQIRTGFYSADIDLFSKYYEQAMPAKRQEMPKRFLYIGRYLDFKGVFDMWEAFLRLQDTTSDWEFYCAGTGDAFDQRIEHDKIKHFGFIQPSDLGKLIHETSVFVLPSHKEPWAVTVHEFAAAGFPLICSDRVGAASQFVVEGENGYSFPAGDREALYEVFKKVVDKTPEELLQMAENSRKLADKITPSKWAETLINLL